jgi:hypothetical protein
VVRSTRAALRSGVCLALGAVFTANAHVHGEGHLDLALDGTQVSIELRLPGDTVVGFESAPQDAVQRQAVQAARRRFEAPDLWLALPAAAGCSAGPVEVDLPAYLSDNSASIPAAEDADAHAHHQHGDDHGHAAKGDDHAVEGFDWHIATELTCADGQAVTEVDLAPLFAALPRLQTVQVQYIGVGGQSGSALSRRQPRFVLPDR